MELTLVRHGQSAANRDGILQGQYDSPLSELGRRQAEQVGAWFAARAMAWEAVYCSPLSRARDTASIIAERLGHAAPIEDPDLAEIHAGDMQGKTGAVLRLEHASFYARGLDGLADYSEFNGESYEAVQRRVRRFIDKIIERHRLTGDRVLLVSHGGLLFQLAKMLICQPVPRVALLKFGNCSVTRIALRERRGTYIGEIEWHLPLDLLGGEPSGGAAALLY
ncbi:MAG TPA: histidine phosphatase family protein [Polyangiaceae bacterium]|nr:histidine phosphatase family protein [Polyangiaceae bacterium]